MNHALTLPVVVVVVVEDIETNGFRLSTPTLHLVVASGGPPSSS